MLFKISQYRFQNAAATIAVSIIYAITQGCATMPETEPPSPEIRELLGQVGVVALSTPIRAQFYTNWVKGETGGAAAGAAAGATGGIIGGALGVWAVLSLYGGAALAPAEIVAAASVPILGIPVLAVLGLAAGYALYATVKGAEYGAARAVPDEIAEQTEQQLTDFFANMKLSSGLSEAIYAAAASKPSLAKYSITSLGEVNSETDISYDNFYSQGIKTILEVSVTEIGFQEGELPEDTSSHPIRFYMNARTRLVEAVNHNVYYTQKFQYEGSYRPLVEWLGHSGQRLEFEFKHAQANLAELIIQRLFLDGPDPGPYTFASRKFEEQKVTSTLEAAPTSSVTDDYVPDPGPYTPVPRKFEEQKVTSSPETASPSNVTDYSTEALKVASIPKEVSIARVSLRKKPMIISDGKRINDMLIKYCFFDASRNALGDFENHFFDNNNGTVTDMATGLMWQKSGSTGNLNYGSAKRYVYKLNREGFAGHSDWRMPTVEELASLLKKDKTRGVHLSPVFDNKKITCWTVDWNDTSHGGTLSGAWIVSFKQGEVLQAMWAVNYAANAIHDVRKTNYVKAVRSIK